MEASIIKIKTEESRNNFSNETLIHKEFLIKKNGKEQKSKISFRIIKEEDKYKLLFFYEQERYWLPVRNIHTFNTYIEARNQINLLEEEILKKAADF